MIALRIKSTLRLLRHPAIAGFLAMTVQSIIGGVEDEIRNLWKLFCLRRE